MTPEYISPEETEAEKQRLIQLFKKEIKTHAFLDLTSFVKEHSTIHDNHTHPGFVRSVAFKLEMTGDYEVIPLKDYTEFNIKKLHRTTEERHPILTKIAFAVLGAVLAYGGVVAKNLLEKKPPPPVYKLEDSRTSALYDSVANLRHDLQIVQDSLKRHR